MARRATKAAIEEFEARRAELEKIQAERLAEAQALGQKLEGLEISLSEKAGVRLQIKWMPTWVTTGTGLYCDPFYPYYCYTAGTGESYDQFETSLGIVFTP